jgi:hypothetical protein
LSMDIFLEHAHPRIWVRMDQTINPRNLILPSLVILSPPMLIQVTTVGEVLGTLDTIEST